MKLKETKSQFSYDHISKSKANGSSFLNSMEERSLEQERKIKEIQNTDSIVVKFDNFAHFAKNLNHDYMAKKKGPK